MDLRLLEVKNNGMIRLSQGHKHRLVKTLSFLETELSDIREFTSLDYHTYQTDRHKRRDVERCIENIVNASIDIVKILIAASGSRIPDTYREMFLEIGEIGVATDDVASKLAEGVGLRNKLAHEYLDIRWSAIKLFLTDIWKTYENLKEISSLIIEESEKIDREEEEGSR